MFGLPEFPSYVIRVFDDGALIDHSRQPDSMGEDRHFGNAFLVRREQTALVGQATSRIPLGVSLAIYQNMALSDLGGPERSLNYLFSR